MVLENRSAIHIQDVSYRYPDGILALDGVSLKIMPGERVGIIGPNGAGKSTFLNLLNGIFKPKQGSVQIFDQPITERNQDLIKQWVGLVFQNPEDQLFCPTVFDDVAFGPLNFGFKNEDVRQKVRQALDEVGLVGYEQRSTLSLSFGEKKLVAIATALSMEPRIVALDEPTSNLDALHRRKIINWIGKNGRTCVITSHDLDMIYDTCHRTVILNKGKIVAVGETRKILRNKEILESNDLELPLSFQRI
ncbi:MAG: ABC transporter ATP-binding protein [Calditrichaeota bacterium]|nr:ABC transporter ATP-binding protein [Calditrichota bacterium]